MSDTLFHLKQVKRQHLKELYYQCTEEQQKKFKSMHGDINSVADDKVDLAISQCENTLKKNNQNNPPIEINVPTINQMVYYIDFAEYYIFPDITLRDGWIISTLIKNPNTVYKNLLTLENVKLAHSLGYKLLLRPYSDITQEEYDEYISITELVSEEKSLEFSLLSIPARRTEYLVSKGIDVFDLIKQGKALDKTLLKNIKIK